MAKIVIVDDALFIRKLLASILVKAGHEIVGEAATAKDAIALYEKLQPDLLTLDIVMPEIDGVNSYEAIKRIKALNNEVKIVMITAMGQQNIMDESFEAGADNFIIKPFQEQNVVNTINQSLRI